MSMFETFFVTSAGWITLGVQLFLICAFLFLLFGKKYHKRVFPQVRSYVLWIAFSITLLGSLGSFVFSEVLSYEPCILCWYGRVVLYPQVIILLLAIVRRDRLVIPYVLGLSVVGVAISFYQIIIQFSNENSGVCSFLETSSDCSIIYVLEFGYITIPVMALTTFGLLSIVYSIALLSRRM